MPWECKTMEKLREEFVTNAICCNNFSALCREFGITRKTGYKWLKRYLNGLPLSDMPKTPNRITNKTPEPIEKLIVSVRNDNPAWGAKKIKHVLENEGIIGIPCIKTINNILHRYACILPEESLKHKPYVRFEKDKCNKMWQTDFKGEFKTNDNKYCYPLTIIDDHSRYSIKIKTSLSTAGIVLPSFEAAFKEYGMPEAVLSDNGAQFAGFRHGYTQFEKWLMNHDVLPIHGRMKHPQTQGKIERFHRTMKAELLNQRTFRDIEEADTELQKWREKYNNDRPHEALGMKSPSEVYKASNREYEEEIKKYEYGGENHVIKVNSWGYLRFNRWQIYLSETMKNEYIEIRANDRDGTFSACYRNFKIAEFSNENGELIHRKITRV